MIIRLSLFFYKIDGVPKCVGVGKDKPSSVMSKPFMLHNHTTHM